MKRKKMTMNTTNNLLEPQAPTPPSSPPRPERMCDATPTLRFMPTAWAKLIYFCHRGDTEIGGFGLTHAEDPLLIEDFLTVRQQVSGVSVEFDDAAVADLFENQVDCGRRPDQFARIWCHTHPGNSPTPSMTDEETFHRVFGACDWAIMFILARGGRTYARLRFNTGPGGEILIPVAVDYRYAFPASDHAAWEAEYQVNIHSAPAVWESLTAERAQKAKEPDVRGAPEDWLEELEAMEPAERRLVLDELAARPDLWPDESELMYG